MKINWKVRAHNLVFIGQILASIILPILAYLGLNWSDMTSWPILGQTLLQAIQNPVILVSVIVSVFNAVTDPTTKGISDSNKAMTYKRPSK